MARTTQAIFDSMVTEAKRLAGARNNADAIAMFNNTSNVAVWKLIFYVMAYCVMTFETLLDAFQTKVDDELAQLRPHTYNWYRNKAKAFQYGFPLVPDTDVFDNTGYTQADIDNSKLVKYASCTTDVVDGVRVLLMKIAATDSGGDLVPLGNTNGEYDAFKTFMAEVKDAGVYLVIYNNAADLIRATVDVYYNPMLIDDTGLRTDGNGYPVMEAANNYPLTLEFDGEFINAGFIDALQAAYGVSRKKVNLSSIERQTAGGSWQVVNSSFVPEAGYAKYAPNGLTINYIADV